MAQPEWEFVLADRNGTNLTYLTLGSDRKLTRQDRGAAVLELQVPLTSPEAALIEAGTTRIKGYRLASDAGPDDDKVIRFNGVVWVTDEQANDEGVSFMKVVAVDPFGCTLPRRFSTANFGTVDQGTLLKQLVDNANAVADTFVQTNSANVSASITRTVDWSLARKSIADGFNEIANAFDGTDWELRPVDNGAKIAELYVYGGRRGSARDEVVFGYGEGTVANCTAFARTSNMDRLATWVHGDGQGGAYFEWTNPTKVTEFGRYERYTSYADVANVTHLSNLVYEDLVRSYDPVPIIGFTAGTDAPRMFDDWDICDTVRVQGRHGSIAVDTTARIIGATVTIDNNGVETASSIVLQGEPTEESGSTSTGVS